MGSRRGGPPVRAGEQKRARVYWRALCKDDSAPEYGVKRGQLPREDLPAAFVLAAHHRVDLAREALAAIVERGNPRSIAAPLAAGVTDGTVGRAASRMTAA